MSRLLIWTAREGGFLLAEDHGAGFPAEVLFATADLAELLIHIGRKLSDERVTVLVSEPRQRPTVPTIFAKGSSSCP